MNNQRYSILTASLLLNLVINKRIIKDIKVIHVFCSLFIYDFVSFHLNAFVRLLDISRLGKLNRIGVGKVSESPRVIQLCVT